MDMLKLEGTALILGRLALSSYYAGFNSDRAYGYIILEDPTSLTTAKLETSYTELNSDELVKYMISACYIPEANRLLSDPGIVLINGNFVNYTTAVPIYLSTEDRVLFTADIVRSPYFP